MEQQSFEGEGFQIGISYILDNKESVADFFGDSRDTWYKKLLKGGIKYPKTSLDSNEEYDVDLDIEKMEDTDLPPLDPEKITEGKAANIVTFFEEYPEAKKAFLAYASSKEY